MTFLIWPLSLLRFIHYKLSVYDAIKDYFNFNLYCKCEKVEFIVVTLNFTLCKQWRIYGLLYHAGFLLDSNCRLVFESVCVCGGGGGARHLWIWPEDTWWGFPDRIGTLLRQICWSGIYRQGGPIGTALVLEESYSCKKGNALQWVHEVSGLNSKLFLLCL